MELRFKCPSTRSKVMILKVKRENYKVKTIFFKGKTPNPGQYCMIWIPGKGEKPMAYSYIGRISGVSVEKIGNFTASIHALKPGDYIGVRGPCGNGFSVKKEWSEVLLVSGGVGIAPLAPLAEKLRSMGIRVKTLMGFKTSKDVFFLDRLRSKSEVLIVTEDGSLGIKGLVSEALHSEKLDQYDQVVVCGPEAMIVSCIEVLENKNFTDYQVSFSRYVKCGIGLCGHCSFGEIVTCIEGPVLSREEIMENHQDLGVFRTSSGRREIV